MDRKIRAYRQAQTHRQGNCCAECGERKQRLRLYGRECLCRPCLAAKPHTPEEYRRILMDLENPLCPIHGEGGYYEWDEDMLNIECLSCTPEDKETIKHLGAERILKLKGFTDVPKFPEV